MTVNFPEDIRVEFSWEETTIPSNDETILEITWNPDCECSSRFSVFLGDGRRHKIDVPVAFKSVLPKV